MAFWTTGPIPLLRLDAFALRRPRATVQAIDALESDGLAILGGGRGTGRTTLAHQIAMAMDRAAFVVDGAALIPPTPEAMAQAVLGRDDPDPLARLQEQWRRGRGRLLVLDRVNGLSPSALDTLSHPRTPVLLVQDGAGIVPDPLDDTTAALFLRRRVRTLGMEWDPEALALVVDTAAGAPDALQWIGRLATDAAAGRHRTLLDEDAALEAISTASYHLPSGLATALGGLTGQRALLLKAMSRDPQGTPTEWANACQIEPKAISVHLGRLRDEGMVLTQGRGRHVIASPLVARHLRAAYGTPVQRLRGR